MRISVVGASGAGKSTLARALADELGLERLELDSIHHQPNWQALPDEEFADRVRAFVAAERWIVDGNYSVARPIVWSRADTVIWLDQPRWQVMSRLVRRTLGRGIRRTELWNGNRESLRSLLNRGEDNLLLWSWHHHRIYRERYTAAMTDPGVAHVRFIRITGAADPRLVAAMVREHNPNVGRTDG